MMNSPNAQRRHHLIEHHLFATDFVKRFASARERNSQLCELSNDTDASEAVNLCSIAQLQHGAGADTLPAKAEAKRHRKVVEVGERCS